MNINRAKEILEKLSNGIDPVAGGVLPPENVCNQVEVVRAFYTILHELGNAKPTPQKNSPENAGKPWSKEDDVLLSQMYDEGATIQELSKHFKRTNGAITSRLARLGKICF